MFTRLTFSHLARLRQRSCDAGPQSRRVSPAMTCFLTSAYGVVFRTGFSGRGFAHAHLESSTTMSLHTMSVIESGVAPDMVQVQRRSPYGESNACSRNGRNGFMVLHSPSERSENARFTHPIDDELDLSGEDFKSG